ncbi:golvesin C-terminal-like domain-containing protein [Myceligenerans cantabricum]
MAAGLTPATAADDAPGTSGQGQAAGESEPVQVEELLRAVPEAERAEVLPRGWASSDDVAWATVGDHHGFHVLTASASSGYEWGVTVTLSEPGIETDEWVGNACVTSSGRYAVVVYAPRSFVNDPDLFDRGGLAAIVDLASGEATKLAVTASLAYFNPGCGADDRAVITAARAADDRGDTHLVTVDADRGRIDHQVTLTGQITSAIPLSSSVSVAATGSYISRIGSEGDVVPLAAAGSTPYSLTLDRQGGLSFMAAPRPQGGRHVAASPRRPMPSTNVDSAPPSGARTADDVPGSEEDLVAASRLSRDQLRSTPDTELERARVFARGPLHGMGLEPLAHSKGTLVGDSEVLGDMPPGMTRRPQVASGVRVNGSTRGKVFLSKVGWNDQSSSRMFKPAEGESGSMRHSRIADPELPRQARLTMQVPAREASRDLGVVLDADATDTQTVEGARRTPQEEVALATGSELSPALGTSATAGMVSEELVDGPERGCAVTRGDPRLQAMQPRPRQVEWAVDQLVQGTLDHAFYPEGRDQWRTRVDMPQYVPSDLVPLPALAGPGTVADIPPQILLGIAMSESNMQQAARSAVPGVTGNPLIGNYWGVTDSWDIAFADVDCGYGVMQVTDGMELGDNRDTGEQNAIAVDYVANIQAGAAILIEKWNQTYNAGMLLHDGNPRRVENWFYALWAYNSGFYSEADADENLGAWGLGWHNNPANPKYPYDRHPFLNRNTFDDGRTPNLWPYPERSIGFAAWSSELIDGVGTTAVGFRPAQWTHDTFKEGVDTGSGTWDYSMSPKPPLDLFCDETNECDKGHVGDVYTPPGAPEVPGPCYSESGDIYDYHCWYHEPASWKDGCAPADGANTTCGLGFIRFPGVWSGDEDPYEDGTQTNPHSNAYDEEENQRSYSPNCSQTGSATTNNAPPNSWIVDDVPDGVPSVKQCARSSSDGTFTWRFNQASDGSFPPKKDIHQIGAGWQGHFYFSHTRTGEEGGTGERLRAEGTWTLGHSYDGWMRIAVHLPDHGAHTQQAHYEIDLNGDGAVDRDRYINQRRMANNWVSLGSYRVTGTPRVALSNITADGEGTQDVAWDAVAFQPLAQEPVDVAVLGDSYAAGEGTGFAAESGSAGYYPETNIGAEYKGTEDSDWQNSCRRSPDAWARKLAIPGVTNYSGEAADSWSEELELGFVACSGARTVDLADEDWSLTPNVPWFTPQLGEKPGRPQYGEVRQTQSGVLSEDTDYVLLTIGGNDGGLFAGIVKNCVYEKYASPDSWAQCAGQQPLVGAQAFVSDHTIPRIEEVILDISSRAPNATVVLGTYPMLFDNEGVTEEIPCSLMSATEVDAVRAVQRKFREELEYSALELRNLLSIDIRAAFVEEYFEADGPHHACTDPSERWINSLVFTKQGDGDPADPTSMASVHPNDLGVVAYADAFSCVLFLEPDAPSSQCIPESNAAAGNSNESGALHGTP